MFSAQMGNRGYFTVRHNLWLAKHEKFSRAAYCHTKSARAWLQFSYGLNWLHKKTWFRGESNENRNNCSRTNVSPVQNTLLYDPCNQAAGCGSLREKRRALKRNVPKGPLVFLYHIKELLEASEVLNSGTGGCSCKTISLYGTSCNWTAINFHVPELTLSLVQHRCVTTRGTVASWHIAAGRTAHQSDSCQDTICSRRLFRIYISLQKDLAWRIITLTGRWRAKNRFSHKSSCHC